MLRTQAARLNQKSIGCMAAAVAKHAGARYVVVTDVNPWRLDLAKKMDGFIEAGKTIQLISSVEAQAVIDEAHFVTFGESREERREKLHKEASEADDDTDIDWDQYDSPTVTRRSDL